MLRLKLDGPNLIVDYDPVGRALYVRVRSGRVHKTREEAEDVHVDLDRAGRLLGVEVLDPGRTGARVRAVRRRLARRYHLSELTHFHPDELPKVYA